MRKHIHGVAGNGGNGGNVFAAIMANFGFRCANLVLSRYLTTPIRAIGAFGLGSPFPPAL